MVNVGYILKVRLTAFANNWMWGVRENEEDDSKALGLSNPKILFLSTKMGRLQEGAFCRENEGEIKSSVSDLFC